MSNAAAVLSTTLPGTRSLVVVARERGGETRLWLDEIRARLAPRLPLGQRLEVLAPRYVSVGVRASLRATPDLDLRALGTSAAKVLSERLAVVAADGGEVWRLGRELSALELKGWLRALPGVLRVVTLELLADGRKVTAGLIELGRLGLPQLEITPDDIAVERATTGAVR